jgi:hypothetical protein
MKKACLLACFILGCSLGVFAKDGSDPMPLCYPTPTHPCKKFPLIDAMSVHPKYEVMDITLVAPYSEPTIEVCAKPDGGPLPMCPPCHPGGSKNCGPNCDLSKWNPSNNSLDIDHLL